MLTNPSFPLLRYAIGDAADGPLERPAQGFASLTNVAGRNNDLVVTRTGRHMHSSCFEHVFKYHKTIRRYRVHQQADGSLSVAVERAAPEACVDTQGLERQLRLLVEEYPVRLELVDIIPQTPAGKHRWILSDAITQRV